MNKITMLSLTAASILAIAAAPAFAGAPGGTATGAVGGAITGAIVGGPVGAVVGGVIGAIVGTAVSPPPAPVLTYVATQTQPTVTLQGTVSLGATIPAEVMLYPIPANVYTPANNQLYAYAFINGQRVVVDANTRVIVAIVS